MWVHQGEIAISQSSEASGVMVDRAILSWSGGKDCALAFEELRRDSRYQIVSLLTTVTEGHDRVSMHGTRISLIEKQAYELDLPLVKVTIPQSASNEQYESVMREVLARARADGVCGVAFGDVFLKDIRRYREDRLSEVDMKAVFPIWKRDTRTLAMSFIKAGFGAILTCVDSQRLHGAFVGRIFDEMLLRDLPANVDPSGENGEFHTFVHDGPIFRHPIPVHRGERVLRENRFWYCDLIPDAQDP